MDNDTENDYKIEYNSKIDNNNTKNTQTPPSNVSPITQSQPPKIEQNDENDTLNNELDLSKTTPISNTCPTVSIWDYDKNYFQGHQNNVPVLQRIIQNNHIKVDDKYWSYVILFILYYTCYIYAMYSYMLYDFVAKLLNI